MTGSPESNPFQSPTEASATRPLLRKADATTWKLRLAWICPVSALALMLPACALYLVTFTPVHILVLAIILTLMGCGVVFALNAMVMAWMNPKLRRHALVGVAANLLSTGLISALMFLE